MSRKYCVVLRNRFFLVLLSVFVCRSVFHLLSSIAPVSCVCFPAPVFLFIAVCCLSGCSLALLSLSSRCPVHSSLSFPLEFVSLLFAYFASSLRLSCLLSLLSLSWGFFFFSFFAVGSGMFCLLSSLCSPFFAAVATGSALRKFRVSGFTCLFCSASAFTGYCFQCFCFPPSMLFFVWFCFNFSAFSCLPTCDFLER